MQEFVDEYANIKEKIEDLLDDTTNEDLKEELNGLISALKLQNIKNSRFNNESICKDIRSNKKS